MEKKSGGDGGGAKQEGMGFCLLLRDMFNCYPCYHKFVSDG